VTRSLSNFAQRRVAVIVALSALLLTSACGDKVLQGRGSSYLVIDQLTAAPGASTGSFSNVLQSDVLTGGTVYEDLGKVSLHIAMKDVSLATGTDPSPTNLITVNRYHVDYVRSDGRAAQGVDIPYAFDGAVTGTISTSASDLVFVLVRAQAKLEAPLKALVGGGGAKAITMVANVTFYGYDQAGNAVSVVGSITVTFADWADSST